MSIVIFALLNIVMIFSSHLAAYSYFRKDHFSQQLTTAFLLFIAQVTVSTLFLGVIVKDLSLGSICLLNAAVSFLIIFILRKKIKASIRESWQKCVDFSKYLLDTRDYFLYFFLLLFGVQIVILLIKIYYLPPAVWDAFTYHLHPVVEWYQRGMIPLFIDTPVERVNFKSLGSGLMVFWVFTFFRDTTWAELPQFFHGLFLVISSYSIMLKMNVRKNTALRYALLIYFIPSVLIQSRTCQNHLTLTTLILITMMITINVLYRKKYSRVILLFLALGVLLGTKLNAPQIMVALFLALLVSKGFKKYKIFEFLKQNRLLIIIGAGLTLISGSFWHIKNIILFKNPLGPYIPELSWSESFLTNLVNVGETLIKNILAFPFRITDVTTNYLPDLTHISGFGIQFFVFGIIAYISVFLFLIRKKIGRNTIPGLLLFFPVILLFSYFLYYYTEFNYRMFIFFPVFGLILWAFVQSNLKITNKHRVYLDVLILCMILFNMLVCYYPGHIYRETYDWKTPFTVKSSLDEINVKWKTLFSTTHPPGRTAVKYFPYISRGTSTPWGFIDAYVDPGEPIGYLGDRDSWVFPYFDNRLKRKIYHLQSLPGFNLIDKGENNTIVECSLRFKESLKRKKIHYIHLNFKKNKLRINDKSMISITRALYYFDWEDNK
jgi:hypothetical protein